MSEINVFARHEIKYLIDYNQRKLMEEGMIDKLGRCETDDELYKTINGV